MQQQTSDLLSFISGRRNSRQMEQDTQAVLRNLQRNRDRDEAIQPHTQAVLQVAANAVLSPQQAVSQARTQARAYARREPQEYLHHVLEAMTSGTITPEQAIELLRITNHPMLVDTRVRLAEETASRTRERDILLEDWTRRQQLRAQAIANTTPATHQVEKKEPVEPEPEQKPSETFGALTRKRQTPRRILKKLKRPKDEKESKDGHNNQQA